MKFKSTCHLIVPVENYPHLPKYHLRIFISYVSCESRLTILLNDLSVIDELFPALRGENISRAGEDKFSARVNENPF